MPNTKLRLPLVALLGLTALHCEPVPLTAPAGSSIYLQANPTFVPASGGRSVVTALIVEPAGTLVPDGTQVLFLTTLGTIDEWAPTRDGIARVYFVSDSRSGTATVTAISGGPAPAPSPAPSASSAAGTGLTASAASGPVRLAAAASDGGSATVAITVGSALPERVVLGANPQRITSPRYSTLTANVFDILGNPVQNVPVIFTITSANAVTETLASGGQQRFTDSSGQAFDTLFTAAPVGGQTQVEITATTANGVSSVPPVTVYIN